MPRPIRETWKVEVEFHGDYRLDARVYTKEHKGYSLYIVYTQGGKESGEYCGAFNTSKDAFEWGRKRIKELKRIFTPEQKAVPTVRQESLPGTE